ncbi:MAG: glycoside hydrolase domain-containing protein, partial [bacterium]
GNVTSTTEGRFYDAAELSGKGALVLDGLTMSKQRTIEFWVYLSQYPTISANLLHQPSGSFDILINKDGGLILEWDKKPFTAVSNLPLRKWTHVAFNWNWRFTDNAESARLYINGKMVNEYRKLETDKASYCTSLMIGNNDALDNGIIGKIDEIRHSSTAVSYYSYNLDWVRPKQPLQQYTQPYFRDSEDLLLHLPFDNSFNCSVDGKTINVVETELTKRIGKDAVPEMYGFLDGVLGNALRFGVKGAKLTYSGNGWISSNSGTIAFWVRPMGWDTFQSMDFRRNYNDITRIPLFKIYGELSDTAKPRHPMRGNDPSLLAFNLFCMPDSNSASQVEFHPGEWSHITLCWQQDKWRYYINGIQVSADAAFQVATNAWYDRDKQMDVFVGSQPTKLFFDGQFGKNSNTDGTLIDDFRIYRRPLTTSEIANIIAIADPRQKLVKLPELSVSVSGNGVIGRVKVESTPLISDYKKVAVIESSVINEKNVTLGMVRTPALVDYSTNYEIQTGPFDFGKYKVITRALDTDGNEVAKTENIFVRNKPRWWQSKAGISDKVMPGWKPMTFNKNVVSVIGRDITFDGCGFPEQIISAQEKILRAPIKLELKNGDKVLPLKSDNKDIEIVKASDIRIDTKGRMKGDGISIVTDAYTEYDGMIYFTVTMNTTENTPVNFDRLTLTIPYNSRSAELLHWWSGKQDFRNPKVTGVKRVSDTPGLVLSSTDPNVLRDTRQRGSMIPYIMLTGMKQGMAWFAENDKGWTLQNDIPAVQVIRKNDGVDLVITIIAEPLSLNVPRSFQFGLQPIPVKPLSTNWRTVADAGYCGPMIIDSFSGCNLKGGDGTTFNLLPENENWEKVRKLLVPADSQLLGLVNSRNEAFKKMWGREPNDEEKFAASLYWDLHWGGGDPPDNREFLEAYPDDWWLRPEFVDYASWAYEQWVIETKGVVQGVYMDDMWGVPEPGPCSYKLPDGHLQLGYHFLQCRQRIKRIRQILIDHGITPKLSAHSTHTVFITYQSFFDLIIDGEDKYSSHNSQTDFIDHWSIDRVLFHQPAKWGITTTWLGPWGNSEPADKYPAWAFRQIRAFTVLLGITDQGTQPILKNVWPYFKMAESNTKSLSVWNGNKIALSLPENIYAVAWIRPEQALLILANVGNERVEIKTPLNLKEMGFNGQITISELDNGYLTYFDNDPTTKVLTDDPEAEKVDNEDEDNEKDAWKKLPIEKRRKVDPDGKYEWDGTQLSCPIRRHDYRLFLLKNIENTKN